MAPDAQPNPQMQPGQPAPQPRASPPQVHIDAQPMSPTSTPPPPPQGGGGGLKWVIVGALALAAFGAYKGGYLGTSQQRVATAEEDGAAMKFHKEQSKPGAVPMVATIKAADFDANIASAIRQQAQNQQAIAVPLAGVPQHKVEPALAEPASKGSVEWVTVTAYDTCVEDGDYVTIVVEGGVTYGPFMLKNAGTTLAIPVVNHQPPKVTVRAERDGWGGVTLGIQTSTGMWYSKVLAVGDVQPIPFEVQ